MEEILTQKILPYFNYWIYVILMTIGLWAMIAKNNLIKKLIGMSIFQTAIILLYVSASAKSGATIPILEYSSEPASQATAEEVVQKDKTEQGAETKEKSYGKKTIDPDRYANPLPHVLMLTAIVVGVATLGVALAVTQLIYRNYGSIEEDEILAKIAASETNG